MRRALTVVILGLFLITLVLAWEVVALRTTLQWVDHSDEVLSADRELLQLNVDMETCLRGFLLTGDEAFLEPFKEADTAMELRFDALNRLIADNPAQQQRLAGIRSQYIDWLRGMDAGGTGARPPPSFFVENSNPRVLLQRKAVMDRIRAAHLAFDAVEEGLRKERLDRASSGKALVNVLLLLVVLGGGAATLFSLKNSRHSPVGQPPEPAASLEADRDREEELGWQEVASPRGWRLWLRSGASVAGFPLVSLLLSLPLRPYNPYPFVLFYAAASLVTWMEGLWCGLLALTLSLLLVDYYLILPYGSFAIGFDGALGLVLSGCIQLFIVWMIDNQRHAGNTMRAQANLLDLSHDCIMVRELGGQIRFWNHAAEEMYGYSPQEAGGKISFDLLRTEFPRPLAEIEAELLRNRRWEGELQHMTRDGARVVAESRWVMQQLGNGAASRVMETNRDISKRKALEAEREKIAAELARYTRALERSNLELDAFAFAASHDLKAPLRVIHNASLWIEEDLAGKLTAEMSENMNLLRSRVQRMDRLLNDLLEYSRIGRETGKSHTETISGAVLMENILGLVSPPAGFIVDATSSLAGIEVSRMPLQQILINLISNAIKHHDKKAGRIEVSVEDLGAMFRFSVKDDGPGIAAQYHEKIFKMFQTLKPRDQVEGSGMGLAMVRKHLDMAGGELKLESAVGQGSTFSFTWPKDNGSTNKAKHKFTRIGERS